MEAGSGRRAPGEGPAEAPAPRLATRGCHGVGNMGGCCYHHLNRRGRGPGTGKRGSGAADRWGRAREALSWGFAITAPFFLCGARFWEALCKRTPRGWQLGLWRSGGSPGLQTGDPGSSPAARALFLNTFATEQGPLFARWVKNKPPSRDRTHDPPIARRALNQLS